MSSTSNIQNLLVNVFRPTVVYDASTGYVPKLNICNVDTISAKSLSVTTFGLGDSNGNIFIGNNAGGTSSNTNNTVLGIAAGSGMANTTGSVYIGNTAGIGAQGASNVIGIGYNASGNGTSNIFIGTNTGAGVGSSNSILIGHGLDFSTNNISNILQIGRPGSLVIQGDLANKRIGINTAPSYGLDVCGDFSFHNSNGNFTYALDGSGNTQIDFRSSNAGKKAVLNVVGDVYATTFFGDLSGGISTTSVKMGDGSISVPAYSFSNDASTGFYYNPTPPALGTTVRGCNSMYITTTGVGIGTSNISTPLDVSGIIRTVNIIAGNPSNSTALGAVELGGGYNADGTAANRSTPAVSFQYGASTSGGYRHFIRSRHDGTVNSSGNAIDFFTNQSASANGSTAPGTNNVLALSVTSAGVGIGKSNPSTALDVCGTTLSSNVRVGSGTVSAPSYAFSTDTSLGLYRVGANQLGFATAGVQRLTMSNNGIMFSSNGSAGTPLISTTDYSTTGFYFANDAQPAVCQGTQEITRWNGAGMFTSVSGTTTTPSIAWYPEATGFSKPAVGRIAFLTNGSEKMTLSNSNVGIGTSSPATSLDVSGQVRATAGTSQFLALNPSIGAGDALQLFQSSSNHGLYTNSTMPLQFFTGGAQRMTISGERVGIGTAVPGYMLDVVKTGTGVSSDMRLFAGSTGGASSTNTASTIYQIRGAGGGDVTTAFKMDLQSGGYGVSVLNSNNAPYIRFDSTNNRLGIGNTAPSYTLDVCGTARIANTLFISDTSSTTSAGIRIRTSPTIQYFQWGSNISSGVSDASGVKLIFSGINLSGTYMTIDQTNSNVGIGTTAPTQRLDVNGTIRGSSNIVAVATASNWTTPTAFTDTSLTIVYTPKQSGTVTLIVNANATMYTGSGSGFDGVVLQIRNNATVLTDYYFNVSNDIVNGRGNNSYSGGRWATTTVTAATPINIRVTRVGDDVPSVRDGYLSIYELSTT